MIHIYLDSEFDAVRVKGKYTQAVISIGAVLVNEEGIQLDQFYNLVKPEYFKRLNPIVARMTHLTTEQIKAAHHLKDVMRDFRNWIRKYEKDSSNVLCYSFGPDDRRTLIQNCKFHEIEDPYFEHMHDLQKVISMQVGYMEKVVSPTLSLEDLKAVYEIHGEVEHNALTDAIDLMKVHQAYCRGNKQNSTQIEVIVKRKLAKQAEVKKRQQEKLKAAMKKRFATHPKHIDLLFYPEVLEQLRALKEQGSQIPYRLKKDHLEAKDGQCIPYEELRATLSIELEKEYPKAVIRFLFKEESYEIILPLTYQIATAVEIILTRCI